MDCTLEQYTKAVRSFLEETRHWPGLEDRMYYLAIGENWVERGYDDVGLDVSWAFSDVRPKNLIGGIPSMHQISSLTDSRIQSMYDVVLDRAEFIAHLDDDD